MSDLKSHRWDELSAFVDGRLAEADQVTLKAHVASCADCQRDLQDLQQLREQLQASPVIAPPESFYKGILDKIESSGVPEKPATPWVFGWPVKTLATACVLMVIVLVTRQEADKKLMLSERTSVSSGLKVQDVMTEADRPAPKPGAESAPAAPVVAPALSEGHADAMNAVEPKAALKDARYRKKEDSAAHDVNMGIAFDKASSMSLSAGSRREGQPVDEKRKDALQKNMPARSLSISQAKKLAQNPWKGDQSGVAEPRTSVVKSVEEWKALWDEHAGQEATSSPAPEVDFRRYTVIAVFAGPKPSAGYGILIKRIQFLPDAVSVEYLETAPPPGMAHAAVITHPFEFRLIPHTELPVRFQKQTS